MAKEAHLINDFSGGLNSFQDSRDIKDNQFSELNNLTVNRSGSITGHKSASNEGGTMGQTDCHDSDIGEISGHQIAPGYGLGAFEIDKVDNADSLSLPNHSSNNITGTCISGGVYVENFPTVGGASPTVYNPNSPTYMDQFYLSPGTAGLSFNVITNWNGNIMTRIFFSADSTMFSGGANATTLEPGGIVYPSYVGQPILINKYFPVGSWIQISGTATNAAYKDEDESIITTTQFPNGMLDGIYEVTGGFYRSDGRLSYIIVQGNIFDPGNEVEDNPAGFYALTVLSYVYINMLVYYGATGRIDGSFTPGGHIFLSADINTAKIDTKASTALAPIVEVPWEVDQINLYPSEEGIINAVSRVKYYSINEAIRCCDTNHSTGSSIKWYGFIANEHFANLGHLDNGEDVGTNFIGPSFFDESNILSPPGINYAINNPGSLIDPTAGRGFTLNLFTVSDDQDPGSIPDGEYEFGESLIYDGNQESLVTLYYTEDPSIPFDINISEEDGITKLGWQICAKGVYGNRVTGGRIYIREKNSGKEWSLFVDINLTKGARNDLFGPYMGWKQHSGTLHFIRANAATTAISQADIRYDLSEMTYDIINGYNSDIDSNSIGSTGETWSDAIIKGNRIFICNVTRNGRLYPDSIYYSEKERFDTFPSHNYLAVGAGDAEGYRAISTHGDRILAFKDNSLDIIDASSDVPAEWISEHSLKHLGVKHPEAVTETPHGAVWANKFGCYLYDGNEVLDLTKDKIKSSVWGDFITDSSMVVYEKFKRIVFVIRSSNATDENDPGTGLGTGDVFEYDINLESWTFQEDLFPTVGMSNVIHNQLSDKLLYARDDTGSAKFFKYLDIDQITANTKFLTKDIDFDDPTIAKKIYAVYMTYRCNQDIGAGSYLKVYSNGTSTSTAFTNGTSTVSSLSDDTIPDDSNWIQGKWTTADGSPITLQTMKLEFDTGTDKAIFHCNDITIEYRTIENLRYAG